MLALKNLLRRKVRTLFAALQIAVAIATFLSIVGITQGLRAQFYRISQVFAFDLIVQPKGTTSPIFSVIDHAEADAVRAVPGVEDVSLMAIHLLRMPGMAQPLTALALEPGSVAMGQYRVVEGRALAADDEARIVIGRLLADELGLRVGDTAEFMGAQRFEVVGLFEPPIKDVPFLAGQAIMPLGHYERINRRPPMILIAHTAVGRMATTPDEARAGLDRCEELAPAVDAAVPRLEAKTIEAFLDSFKQVELIDSFALAIWLLAAVVSVFGVTNTMLMSVFDRTREIGLLRAVGWSRLRIVSMIEAEGALLALAGGLLGVPIGLLLIQASKLLIGLGWLSIELDARLYLAAVGVSVGIGLLGSLYPAVRAASLEPTEALRYE